VTVEAPKPPREPELEDDLRAVGAEELLRERRADDAELAGLVLGAAELHNLRLRRVALRSAELAESTLRGADFGEVVVTDGSWANAAAEQSTLAVVLARGLRATGVGLGDARLADCTFADCRLDLASFRGATLDRVAFLDCRLDEADFRGATLRSVRFERCVLTGADLQQAHLERCELRGCELGGLHGVDRLRGARLPWPDVVLIAGLLAAAAGIEIVD
jgi:uncharacterized protein YjbI with pentapeptide repeats